MRIHVAEGSAGGEAQVTLGANAACTPGYAKAWRDL